VQDLVLGVLEAGEATPVDELALEGRDPGFGHRVVVGVALGADRGGGAELVAPAGVADARVLGGSTGRRNASMRRVAMGQARRRMEL
jgi:hypothetical protein